MTKGVKIMFFLGGVGVIGTSIFLYIKKRKEETEKTNEKLLEEKALADKLASKDRDKLIRQKAQEEAAKILAESLTPLRKNRCGMISSVNTPSSSGSQYVGIHVNSPRPKKGDIVKGDLIRIQNTNSVLDAEYEVLKVWLDKDGKVGAVDINHDYPAQGDGDNSQDRVFNGIKSSICY